MKSRFMVGVIAASVLSACATSFPSSPEAQATFYVNEARKVISAGGCHDAGRQIDFAISRPTGIQKTQDFFEGSSRAFDCYVMYIENLIDQLSAVYYAFDALERIETAADAGILPADIHRRLSERLVAKIVEGNQSGVLPFDLGDRIESFPELESPENFTIIVNRTITNLQNTEYRQDRNRMTESLMAYVQAIGVESEEGQRIESLLPTLNVRRGDLTSVAAVFPEFANAWRDELSIQVHLQVENGDLLLEEDLRKALDLRIRGLEWVDSPGDGVVELAIEKVRHVESNIPESSQTISYARHQVNLVGGVLLMPNNSSYLYELIQGGASIEYGYVVTARGEDAIVHNEVVRGNVRQEYARCQNARIQNVFGGVTPANFVANRDMETRCNRASSVSMEDMRSQVYSAVAEEVLRIKPIRNVHDLN